MTISQEILEISQQLHQLGFLSACDGNISYRISDEEIIITPSGVSKARIKEADLAVINIENKVIKGNPSSERLMHLEVYKRCPNAKAIVHSHPPVSIAWSIAEPSLKELPSSCMSELILAVGSIPIVPYARPGTQDMGDVLHAFIPKHKVIILARHGALVWGDTLEEARLGTERLEHSAKIMMYAKMMGGITNLPESEVEHLKKLRESFGNKIL